MSTETSTPQESSHADSENQHCFTPRVDIWETGEALQLELEMPGVAPDAVDIRLEDHVLNVLGRVAPNAFGERLHGEYESGNFERAFRISERIESDGIKAKMHHGLLTLVLPKSEVAKPRRIAVNIE